MREHRQSARKRIKEWGKIIGDGGRIVLNCTIMDISDSGARLHVSHHQPPDEFYLLRKKTQELRPVVVMNRMLNFVGVRFAGEPLDFASEKARALLPSLTALV